MKVRLTTDAEADLEAIADHIADDDPRRALSFVRELRDIALSLGDFPDRFPLVPRYATFSVRRRVHGRYLLFYRAEASAVVVLRVIHGARDYEPLLFPSDDR